MCSSSESGARTAPSINTNAVGCLFVQAAFAALSVRQRERNTHTDRRRASNSICMHSCWRRTDNPRANSTPQHVIKIKRSQPSNEQCVFFTAHESLMSAGGRV